jgi:hypothetical protein
MGASSPPRAPVGQGQIGSAGAVQNEPHTCIIGCERHLLLALGPISHGGRARPKGAGLSSATVWTLNVPGLAEPRVTFSSATVAGSMPAAAPLREGGRCDSLDHFGRERSL